MISFDEAAALVARRVHRLGVETIALGDAAGRTLAADLVARTASPRHAVSAMDGYAVAASGLGQGETLKVIGESRAGAGFAGRVREGEAVRIFTGARVPEGADCVVMQEHAKREGDAIRFAPGWGPATHVRAAGSDFVEGEVLVPAGTRLNARAMVAAAAADRAEVVVALRPRVAILATGDELAAPGTAHAIADAIPESVSHGVAALVVEAGGRIVSHRSGVDNLAALSAMGSEALEAADIVVVTGGASVGDRDFAKPAFAAHGLEAIFERVAIKPGKPVWLGTARGRLVLGLPGNPTSAMVTAALFLRPILARMQGAEGAHRWRRLRLAGAIPATGDRETFLRARWDTEGLVALGNQDSGVQGGLLGADWLVRCPAGQPALAPGSTIEALAF